MSISKPELEAIKEGLDIVTERFFDASANLKPTEQDLPDCYFRKAYFDAITAKDSINKALELLD